MIYRYNHILYYRKFGLGMSYVVTISIKLGCRYTPYFPSFLFVQQYYSTYYIVSRRNKKKLIKHGQMRNYIFEQKVLRSNIGCIY